MGKILKKLQKSPRLHASLRSLYGKTFGLWPLKTWYVKNIGFFNGKGRVRLIEDNRDCKILSDKIFSGKPFMLGRFGSTEFRTLFKQNSAHPLHIYSGFFPDDDNLIPKFRDIYAKSSKYLDILEIWNYNNHFFEKKKLIRKLPNIEHFFVIGMPVEKANLWIDSLRDKKVLIIHPFKATIEKQYKKKSKLNLFPKFKKLQIIKAVQTIGGENDPRFKNWFEALEYMKREVDKADFDVAILGCGAYGFPLAAYIKSIGKQALHFGGGTQLLFGIKGKRWDNSKRIKYGKHWIYPLEEDIPKTYKKIESGCYWK